ncbi:MAG: hypothetical protein KGI54_17245 [Pseudomonadota bacterium]|nr:hypothetical protein [Pseudomonadota bacterium]
MNYRNKKILQSARDETCIVCGSRYGVVWAHSNELTHGKGRGIKAHDLLGLYLCFDHHQWYDSGDAPRDKKREFFREHYPACMVRLCEKGILE